MPAWRPAPVIRPIAIGVIRRDYRLLVMAVRDDHDNLKGWRPLGGTIEFGERAADALKREFIEELDQPIQEPTPLTVFESLYLHHGTCGHEIVFAFEAAFANEEAYNCDGFIFDDAGVTNEVRWVPLNQFITGSERLYPVGLLSWVNRGSNDPPCVFRS
jgi:ADP-ribose pyrophosphatase YjhB (NUDIX family)